MAEKHLRIPKYPGQDLQDECSDRLRSFTQPRRVPRSVCYVILKGNGHWETLLIRYYFIVDVGMEMSSGATHHNEWDHVLLMNFGVAKRYVSQNILLLTQIRIVRDIHGGFIEDSSLSV